MLRAWQDVIVKWRLLPYDQPADQAEARRHTHRGRSALVAGRLDEALAEFEAAASLRPDPLDRVGVGDVFLARGGWRTAEENYRVALLAGGVGALLGQVGLAQVKIGQGNAAGAVADLELLVADRPNDQVLRYYLASAWYSAAEQCRSRTADDVLVITSATQLRICEDAARRILALSTGDDELEHGAKHLLAEVGQADGRARHDHRGRGRAAGQHPVGVRRRHRRIRPAVRDRLPVPQADVAPKSRRDGPADREDRCLARVRRCECRVRLRSFAGS